jgi:hypothetical protein
MLECLDNAILAGVNNDSTANEIVEDINKANSDSLEKSDCDMTNLILDDDENGTISDIAEQQLPLEGYHTFPNGKIESKSRPGLSRNTFTAPSTTGKLKNHDRIASIPLTRTNSITVVSGSVAASDQWEFSATTTRHSEIFSGDRPKDKKKKVISSSPKDLKESNVSKSLPSESSFDRLDILSQVDPNFLKEDN